MKLIYLTPFVLAAFFISPIPVEGVLISDESEGAFQQQPPVPNLLPPHAQRFSGGPSTRSRAVEGPSAQLSSPSSLTRFPPIRRGAGIIRAGETVEQFFARLQG